MGRSRAVAVVKNVSPFQSVTASECSIANGSPSKLHALDVCAKSSRDGGSGFQKRELPRVTKTGDRLSSAGAGCKSESTDNREKGDTTKGGHEGRIT